MTLVDLLDELDCCARREHAADVRRKIDKVRVARNEDGGARAPRQGDQVVVLRVDSDGRRIGNVVEAQPMLLQGSEEVVDLVAAHASEPITGKHHAELAEDGGRHYDLVRARIPQLDQAERRPAPGEKCRDVDAGVDYESQHLRATRSSLVARCTQFLVGDALGLVGVEIEACCNSSESPQQGRLPQGFLHDLRDGASLASRGDANGPHHISVDVEGGLHFLGHRIEVYHQSVMKERR